MYWLVKCNKQEMILSVSYNVLVEMSRLENRETIAFVKGGTLAEGKIGENSIYVSQVKI